MWTRFAARLRAWRSRGEIRNAIDDELRFHVDMEREVHQAEGLSPDAARRQAIADLGGTAHVRDEILEVRTPDLVRFADRLSQDVRYGSRAFARAPVTTLSVVGVLACGIGLNAAIFSAIDAIFFRALPVPDASAVVYVSGPAQAQVDDEVFRERANGAVLSVAATESSSNTLTSPDLHLWANGEFVTADYFETLELRPALGRFFIPSEDDARNVDRSVVLSDDLWRQALNANPNAIGQRVRLDGQEYTIIGIAPRGFHGVSLPWRPSQFWATFAQRLAGELIANMPPKTVCVAFVARLAPGVSARDVATMTADRLGRPNSAPRNTSYVVRPAVGPLAPTSVIAGLGYVRTLADAIAVMALVVMLIAASNVVGILLARGISRSTELAIRQAVGASGPRLVTQLLTESLMLGVSAGVAGVGVAYGLLKAYRAVSPVETALDVAVDLHVVVYTLVICGVAGLVVGLAPARQALRLDVFSALGAMGVGTPRRLRHRLRYGSVVPQLALSIALLVLAGAHARTLFDLEFRPSGYRVDHVLTVHLLPPGQYWRTKDEEKKLNEENQAFYETVSSRLKALPTTAVVAFASALPPQVAAFPRHAWVSRDSAERRSSVIVNVSGDVVSGDFFRAFDIQLLAGRTFDDHRDTPTSSHVAIVNSTLAHELVPDGNAVGLLISPHSSNVRDPAPVWYEIVGVVSDTQDGGVTVPMVYRPLQMSEAWVPLWTIVRASTEPGAAAAAIRRTITSVSPTGAVSDVLTMSAVIADDHYARRLALGLLVFAGVFGTLLATAGLYSAVSYWVAQQIRDLGVRATLGATRRDLIGFVIWDGAKIVLTALVPGVLLGFLGFHVTANLVRFVIGPVSTPGLDVVSAVVVLVTAVTLCACYVPGRRAASADPLLVLRA